MGSGGPRGLQILLSGGSSVRGGFDSHTFPPRTSVARPVLLLVIALAATAPVAFAQEGVNADTTAVGAPVDAPSREAQTDSSGGFLTSPTGVAVRSILIPGWGQATNGEWLKAGFVFVLEGAFVYGIIKDTQTLSEMHVVDARYQQVEQQRIAKAWWLGGIVLLSAIDAYVGAHLKGVDASIEPEPLEDGGVALAVSASFR